MQFTVITVRLVEYSFGATTVDGSKFYARPSAQVMASSESSSSKRSYIGFICEGCKVLRFTSDRAS